VAEIRQRVASLLERRRTEDRLRLLERSMEHAMSGITILDGRSADWPVRYVNATFAEMTGYSKEELIDRNLRLLAGPETDLAALGEMREAMAHGRPCRAVIKNYRKDGSTFWNELSLAPVRDEAGLLAYWVGIQTDASVRVRVGELALAQQELEEKVEQRSQDLRQALARLERRRRFTETILDALTSGVITTDAAGRVSFANDTALTTLRMGLSDCLGRPLHEVLGESEDLVALLEQPSARGARSASCLLHSPSGVSQRVELTVVDAPEELREELGRVLSFREAMAQAVSGLEVVVAAAAVRTPPLGEKVVVPPQSLLRQAMTLLQPLRLAGRRPLLANPLQELPAVRVDERPVVEALLGVLEVGVGLVGPSGRLRVRLRPPSDVPHDEGGPARVGIEVCGEDTTAPAASTDGFRDAESHLAIVRKLLETSDGQLQASSPDDPAWRLTVLLPASPD
jgi:PAS domain S-box-containing protein